MIPLPEDWIAGGWFQNWLDPHFSEDEDSIENYPYGLQPVFFFTLLPHYFATGVAAGSGTFVNVTFVAPDRLEVDAEVGVALWTSPVLTALVGNLPTSITPTWELNYPGFDCVIEYRTAAKEADLADAPWVWMANGIEISLSRYYQWRIGWVTIRGWAYDTVEEAEASGSSAWALDAPDPEDPYESYASETGTGPDAYIESVRFTGVFEIDQADLKDLGSCVNECPSAFGDMAAGDHTLSLVNRDYKYSPLHANFIFGGETNWQKKHLLIELAYKVPDGRITSRITLYRGITQSWGPAPHQADETGKLQEHTVQVYTRGLISDFLELKIGTPDEDGKPNPLVCGNIIRQADQLADETLGDPDASADFESGTTEELEGVDRSAGGIVAIESSDPIDGTYYLHTEVTTAGAYAKGRLNLQIAGSEVLFTANLRFSAMPANPAAKNMYFMGLVDASGTVILKLAAGDDYRVYAYADGEWKETEWYLNQDSGAVKTVSIGVSGATSGTLKIWVNSNEVLTWDNDWSAMSIKGGFIGCQNGATAEAWVVDSDKWKIFPNWWPQLFRVAGGPYESIGTIYVDGAVRVVAETLYTSSNRRGLRYGTGGVCQKIVAGKTKSADVEKYPEYGAIAFTDYDNQVSGTVMAYFRKDSMTHWVDIVRAVIAAKGKETFLDETAAAAAKALTPDDSVGCYFENMTVGEAIKSLASVCLFSFFETQDRLKLVAYTGLPPETYEMELTEANSRGVSPALNMDGIKNKVFGKYGLYDRNSRLSFTAKDEESISYLGVYDTEIDLAWGGIVGSDNGPMCQQKVGLLLKRLAGMQLVMDESHSPLSLLRLEPEDGLRINIPAIGAPVIMRVASKSIDLNLPKGVRLNMVKYLGEEVPS